MHHRTLLVLTLAILAPWSPLRAQAGASPPAQVPDVPAAEHLLAEGEAEAAAAAFAELVARDPDDARAWLGLGKARHELGEEQDALAALARAAEMGAPEPSVAFHTARVHASLGDLDAVATWLGRLADTGTRPWGQLQATPELAALIEEPALQDVMGRLRPCGTEPFRQFDFWVGEWDVHPARGGPPASSSIASLHSGCVIRESYGNGPFSGMSMNFYDEADGLWHQVWVGSGGLILRLQGGWDGESMVLSDEGNRITWTPAEDGTVRQVWEQTRDGGETWNVVFDGTYVEKAGG